MFTITSDVPSDMPMLASSEQQRFAAENQDVLPQGPLQPTHVPVGLHPGQPPPMAATATATSENCAKF